MTPRSLPARLDLDLHLDQGQDPDSLRETVARRLGVEKGELPEPVVVRRALDARRGRPRYRVTLALDPECAKAHFDAGPSPREVSAEPRVVIVGDGPAGLFCAYELARHGFGSVVLERGKPVQPRRRDLVTVQREGRVDPESNYCFGEGGAGTFSDGKLYTRATKRGDVRDVLAILVAHGAPPDVLIDTRPHVGSNRLPKVVTALRERLESIGVEFRFGAKVTGLDWVAAGAQRRVVGVRLADGAMLGADAVVVATGHSARDVFVWLNEAGCRLTPKGFAVGVRVEHPQDIVNRARYGRWKDDPRLPNADYQLVAKDVEPAVFTFCMCPGGFMLPATTEPGQVVINGMSLSRRDSPFANAGVVVAVSPQALERAGHGGALGGVAWQALLEGTAYSAGGGAFQAPATRLSDLVAQRASTTLPASSYQPGLTATDVAEVLDVGGLGLSRALREALRRFDRMMHGFVTEEAVAVAVESRTSSPVRVERHPVTLEAIDLERLYPAGEGMGHAGGIVSAALDGMSVARRIAERFGSSANGPSHPAPPNRL